MHLDVVCVDKSRADFLIVLVRDASLGLLPVPQQSPPAHKDLTNPLCAPEFNLVGARMREAYATRLGSVHLLGDARRTHVRRSRHLLFTTRRSRAVESPGSRVRGTPKY
ncbi:hypothetical protein CRG98_015426 [Punica granatum]|uniref:Uncharacterized protein n=1 Tax=Punica granatum TaxID=22663 RepID=A0A2I0K7N5_PUNGR|nr:hypothetical protein CRG98_015426 [Punica granatum]